MLDPAEVTACIVTRGDVDLDPILETLVFDEVIVWDNTVRPDWKVAGRYMAALEAATDLVYWQDDDTIVPVETQLDLLEAYIPDLDVVANWGHGENPDGYDDLPLVGGGAIADRWRAWSGIVRYGADHPLDDEFKYEADFVVGALYRNWLHVQRPFTIRDVAYNGRRLADEAWQRETKKKLADRARAIRDREKATA